MGIRNIIAADLVVQAEHDPETSVVFITSNQKLADSVATCAKEVAEENPIARKSLAKSGVILIASSKTQALAWANQIASEHLTVSRKDVASVQNAGQSSWVITRHRRRAITHLARTTFYRRQAQRDFAAD